MKRLLAFIFLGTFIYFTILVSPNGLAATTNDEFQGETIVMPKPVMPDKVWEITFNDNLNEVTDYNDLVYVLDQTDELVDVTVEKVGRTLKIQPNDFYQPSSTYYLYVDGEVQSAEGMPIEQDVRYQFQTAPYSLDGVQLATKQPTPTKKQWVIQFNKNLDEATVIPDNVFVTDSHGEKIAVDLEIVDDQAIKVIPEERYKYNTMYYVIVQDLKTTAGESLNKRTWMKFITGDDLQFEVKRLTEGLSIK